MPPSEHPVALCCCVSHVSPFCRVSNAHNGSETLALERINLQYWFNGPQNTPDTSDALSLFTMACLDTSLGALSCFHTL